MEIIRQCFHELATSKTNDETITECLTKLHSQLCSINLETRCQYQMRLFLAQAVKKASHQYLSISYSQALFLKNLLLLDPDEGFIMFFSLMKEISDEVLMKFVVHWMEMYFYEHAFSLLLTQQSENPHSKPQWEMLATSFASLPDCIANRLSMHNSFLFHHEKLFEFLGVEFVSCIDNLSSVVAAGKDVNTEFIGLFIGQFCFAGKAAHLFKGMIPSMIHSTQHNYIQRRICHQAFLHLPYRYVQPTLTYLFQNVPSRYCLQNILGDLVLKESQAKFIITHYMLFMKCFSNNAVENIFAYLDAVSDDEHALIAESLEKLMNCWSKKSAIKHTPYEQHRYITIAILVCIRHWKQSKKAHHQGLLEQLMIGVQNHLESPDINLRTLGMLVAERLTEKLDFPAKGDARLRFDYPENEETKALMELGADAEEPNDDFFEKQLEIYNQVKAQFESNVGPKETSYATRKSAFVEIAAKKNIDFSHHSDLDSSVEKVPAVNEMDSDDDDDLQPHELPEEKPFSKLPRPMYIRDCMAALVDDESKEAMEINFDSLVRLIYIDRLATSEVALELCKVLLNMQNTRAFNDFAEIRRDAMASLVAVNPKPVSAYLTSEFYSEHYNLQQRIDILDALVLAAGKLSAIRRKTNEQKIISPQADDVTAPAPHDESTSWREVVAKRIEAKTRRFGKIRTVSPEASADQFGPVAGCFFFPLMAGYDNRVRTLDLLGSDSIVLGRLLYALGTILYSASGSMAAETMSATLFEFIANLRCHAEPFVRRACVYCVSMATAAAPTLTERLGEAALATRDWLCDVIAKDDDSRTRSLAGSALVAMDSKVREELHLPNMIT